MELSEAFALIGTEDPRAHEALRTIAQHLVHDLLRIDDPGQHDPRGLAEAVNETICRLARRDRPLPEAQHPRAYLRRMVYRQRNALLTAEGRHQEARVQPVEGARDPLERGDGEATPEAILGTLEATQGVLDGVAPEDALATIAARFEEVIVPRSTRRADARQARAQDVRDMLELYEGRATMDALTRREAIAAGAPAPDEEALRRARAAIHTRHRRTREALHETLLEWFAEAEPPRPALELELMERFISQIMRQRQSARTG